MRFYNQLMTKEGDPIFSECIDDVITKQYAELFNVVYPPSTHHRPDMHDATTKEQFAAGLRAGFEQEKQALILKTKIFLDMNPTETAPAALDHKDPRVFLLGQQILLTLFERIREGIETNHKNHTLALEEAVANNAADLAKPDAYRFIKVPFKQSRVYEYLQNEVWMKQGQLELLQHLLPKTTAAASDQTA